MRIIAYFLRRNLRIGKYEYDGIAVSMTNNIDIIYEIKYWKDQPSETVLANTLKRLYNAGVNYEGLKHRNFHCILAVITSKDAIERMRSLAERIASDNYCVPDLCIIAGLCQGYNENRGKRFHKVFSLGSLSIICQTSGSEFLSAQSTVLLSDSESIR